jgi:hypothetical protein
MRQPVTPVTELFDASPLDFKIRTAMRQELEKIKAETADDEEATWPQVPYNYTMGRIYAYEQWLESLSEEDREKEISEVGNRYREHYQLIADKLVERLKDQGIDLTPVVQKLQVRAEYNKRLKNDPVFREAEQQRIARERSERTRADIARERILDRGGGRERELER